MRRFFLTAAVVATALTLCHAGEPLLFIGKDVPVYITASAVVRRDDNIGLVSKNKQEDTIFILAPGIDFRYGGEETSFGFAASEQFVRYESDTRLNNELTTVAAKFSHAGVLSRFAVNASYQEIDQTNLSVSSREQSIRRNLSAVSANGGWNVTAKSSVGAGVSVERTTYPALGFVDTDVWSFPIDYYFAISPKVDLSVGYRYRRTSTDVALGGSKDHFYNVGARGQFTSKLNGQVRVGYSTREEDRGAKNNDLGLGASLAYTYSPKTSLSLDLSKDFNNSAFGSSQEVFAVGLSAISNLDLRWQLIGGLSFNSSEYLDSTKRKDDFFVGNVGATYILNTNASFNVSYVFRKNSSNYELLNFDNNVVSLSSALRF